MNPLERQDIARSRRTNIRPREPSVVLHANGGQGDFFMQFKLSTSIALLVQLAAACAFAQTSVPSGPHPRIWLGDSATMARLTAAANANSPEWVRLRNFCNNNSAVTSEYQGDEQYRYAANFSLCYRVTKATLGDAAAAPYAQKAINVLQATSHPLLNFTDYDTDDGYGARNYVPAMALIFDWLYDSPLLTPALKAAIVSRIRDWDAFIPTAYAGAQPVSNYNSGYVLASVLGATAVYGESSQADALWPTALARFNAGRQKFDQTMPGGDWTEGWNYGVGVYERYLMCATALRSATGDPAYVSSTWMANNVVFKPHALTSDGKFFYDGGLWSGDGQGDARFNDMIVAGFAYGWGSTNGQTARAYINKVVAGGVPLTDLNQWNAFLFYDPTSQPRDLNLLTKSYHSVGTGLVTMRSDWNDPTATWGTVTVGAYHSYQAEQDKDAGHMQLYKTAALLMDAGHDVYGEPGIRNTPFHNTFTFENRTDNTARSYPGQLGMTEDCPNPLGTTGSPNFSPATPNPVGISAHIDGGKYVFTSGEYSAAYQSYDIFPSKCGSIPATWLNRNTFYVRPNIFVVYDQVQKIANQPQVVPTMHWHLPLQPVPQAADNRNMTMDNGGGRLQIASVLPVTNSTNRLQFDARNSTDGPGLSNWHLSIRYTDQTPMYQKFLTVLRAGLSVPANTFPIVNAITGTDASGVRLSGLPVAESANPIVVVFADNGARTIPASIQYSYTSTGPTLNYVAKLNPSTSYRVDPTPSGTTMAVAVTEGAGGTLTNTAGVLEFLIGGAMTATVPGAPTVGTATAGNGQTTVTFSPPSTDGGSPITHYTATCTSTLQSAPGTFSKDGTASPLIVTTTTGVPYSCSVTATNDVGTSAPSASANAGGRKKGDVNGNGTVSAFDAANVLQAVVGSMTLDATQQCAADYNENGSASAFDAALILQCTVGLQCNPNMCN
jgi:hypothetical protein